MTDDFKPKLKPATKAEVRSMVDDLVLARKFYTGHIPVSAEMLKEAKIDVDAFIRDQIAHELEQARIHARVWGTVDDISVDGGAVISDLLGEVNNAPPHDGQITLADMLASIDRVQQEELDRHNEEAERLRASGVDVVGSLGRFDFDVAGALVEAADSGELDAKSLSTEKFDDIISGTVEVMRDMRDQVDDAAKITFADMIARSERVENEMRDIYSVDGETLLPSLTLGDISPPADFNVRSDLGITFADIDPDPDPDPNEPLRVQHKRSLWWRIKNFFKPRRKED